MKSSPWRLALVLGLFPILVALDQATKVVAVHAMGDAMRDGILVSDHARSILGDWLWFFIAYNPGSAFSLAPWKLVPFLSPTVFYSILTLAALVALFVYGKRHQETILRVGAICIAAGAVGNLIDRWRIDHVVDFISVGVPGVLWRWPTFNVADVCINIGVGCMLFGEWVMAWNSRRLGKTAGSAPAQVVPEPDAPAASDESAAQPHGSEKDA